MFSNRLVEDSRLPATFRLANVFSVRMAGRAPVKRLLDRITCFKAVMLPIHAGSFPDKELSEKSLSNEKLNELTKHMEVSGNKPSTTYMFDSLTPKVLGKLIAYFEHKVFVMGCIWNINSFDQLGVELGKKLAQEINEIITEPNLLNNNLDSSSAGLIANFKNKSS